MATLGQIVEKYGGLIQTGPFGSQLKQHEYRANGIPVVMPKDILYGKINNNTVARIGEEKADQLSKHKMKSGTIVFPRRGDISKRALIGDREEGYLCGTGCIKIETPPQVIYSRFLYYYLGLKNVVEWIERNAIGTTMLNLNTSILSNIEFPKIPFKIQNQIGDFIGIYDELIENNRRRIQLLEESARLLYREWFVHLRFPGHEYTKIIKSIPEGWKTARISDLGEIVTGKTPSTKISEYWADEIPFIKTPDMHNQSIVINTAQSLSESGANSQHKKFLPPMSILVSCIGTVGIVSLNAYPSQTNQQINSIVPKYQYYAYFSYFLLSSMKSKLESFGGGATMANVNKSKFANIEVDLPAKKALIAFDNIVKPNFQQILKLSKQNQKLTQARDLLLPRLMNGEITI